MSKIMNGENLRALALEITPMLASIIESSPGVALRLIILPSHNVFGFEVEEILSEEMDKIRISYAHGSHILERYEVLRIFTSPTDMRRVIHQVGYRVPVEVEMKINSLIGAFLVDFNSTNTAEDKK